MLRKECYNLCQHGNCELYFVAAGWISGKGRVPYAVLSLMDVIHEYGAEVCI